MAFARLPRHQLLASRLPAVMASTRRVRVRIATGAAALVSWLRNGPSRRISPRSITAFLLLPLPRSFRLPPWGCRLVAARLPSSEPKLFLVEFEDAARLNGIVCSFGGVIHETLLY
ncbi:hypothetical protein Bpro_1761 [Polaromonas sp. JS666]|nr:hypothetical protein Bpro_1761 [Polaromonas sp. JS666]